MGYGIVEYKCLYSQRGQHIDITKVSHLDKSGLLKKKQLLVYTNPGNIIEISFLSNNKLYS